jgi:GNAT superfamily N-acetyltransferase
MRFEKISELPPDFDSLAEEAAAHGHLFLFKMKEEWVQGKNLFNRAGEVLYALRDDTGKLVGIGGLNIDPYAGNPKIGRIRHVYISKKLQRSGLGKQVVQQLIEHAKGRFDLLRLRTHNQDAVSFYLELGFELDSSHGDPAHSYFTKKLS